MPAMLRRQALALPATLLTLLPALLFTLILTSTAAAQDKLALVGGTLIDGSGSQPIEDSIVLIENGRILRVGSLGRLAIPADYRLLSTEGMTVLPGLWDLHVHLLYNGHPDSGHWFETYAGRFASDTMPASARQLLMAGVTGVRDLAANTEDIASLRRRIEAGELPGPQVLAAGAALAPPEMGARPHLIGVADADEARAATRTLIEAGVNFIKVIGADQLGEATVRAAVETAHAAGLRVTAHGRSDEEIRVGLAAGVDEFQHIGTGSPEYPPPLVAAIRARLEEGPPLYWSPTVGSILNRDELAADHEFLEDPRNFAGLPEDIEVDIRAALAGQDFQVPSREEVSALRRKLGQLAELGVILVSGSDLGSFGFPAAEATWRELESWVFELGMDPLRAIQWATSDAAAYVGLGDETGRVSPGMRADIIAVRGSPLRHFSSLRNPAIVIKDGKRYK